MQRTYYPDVLVYMSKQVDIALEYRHYSVKAEEIVVALQANLAVGVEAAEAIRPTECRRCKNCGGNRHFPFEGTSVLTFLGQIELWFSPWNALICCLHSVESYWLTAKSAGVNVLQANSYHLLLHDPDRI